MMRSITMSKENIYTFKHPLKYSTKEGEIAEAQWLEIKEPTSRFMDNIAPIRAHLMRAIAWHEQKRKNDNTIPREKGEEDEKEENTLSAEEMMVTLDLPPDVDTALVIRNVMFMMPDLGLIDGEKKITRPLIGDIHPEDTFGITGRFLINFILPYFR